MLRCFACLLGPVLAAVVAAVVAETVGALGAVGRMYLCSKIEY